METILQTDQITKRYGANVALDRVSLSIPPGIIGLLGPNGSGKSTLIKGLLGLLRFDSGTASVLGHSLPQQLPEIRDAVGYLPEDDCYLSGITGIETTQFMARLSGLPSLEGLRRAHEILDFCDVGGERYRPVESYSTGMRQRLKFANALVHDPQLLILDEPTTGLDPQQRLAMLRRIQSLARKNGKSILLSTHILHDVRTICDHIVILARGQVRVSSSLEELSRPTAPGWSLQVLEGESALSAGLQQAGFSVESKGHGILWVSGAEMSQVDRVWEVGKKVGVSFVQLTTAKNSLESIFLSAVRETDHAVA